MALEEKTLRCRDCGQEFVFTTGEQEFYHLMVYRMIPAVAPRAGPPAAGLAAVMMTAAPDRCIR